MQKHGVNVSIIPTSDPHQSEYISEHWKYRKYLSGFTGSNGTLVIGEDKSGLWTDSRYFLQAESELHGSGIELFKLAVPGTPSIEDWIYNEGYKVVGIDGAMFSENEASRLRSFFESLKIKLISDFRPYNEVWQDRAPAPDGKLFVFPESKSGESVKSKLKRVREIMTGLRSDSMTLASLDDIAWLFNFRGEDVRFNPVAICFAYVDMQTAHIFTGSNKLDKDVIMHFNQSGVQIHEYEEYYNFISQLRNRNILFDKSRNNHEVFQNLDKSCRIIDCLSPVSSMKSKKNETEISGFRKAMIKDGVAWIKLMIWIESATKDGVTNKKDYPDEVGISDMAEKLRKEQGDYLCESFAPIISFKDHGAIVHYEADNESAYTVKGPGVLLMDLGAHFLDGTTDVTRTMYINGEPESEFKLDYTCLLKGVISLTEAIFPENTRGTQLDIMARQYIWKRSLNYLHGTGHGVGHCLYVHEGPQSIRMNENPVTIEPGMIMSNEPALYRTGKYGVRVENVILCTEKEDVGYGRFFGFETLTLVPLELSCLEINILDEKEIDWINNYHKKVFESLSPFLNEKETEWLKNKTRKI
jgi:Xaa-Pro aminopeptidase